MRDGEESNTYAVSVVPSDGIKTSMTASEIVVPLHVSAGKNTVRVSPS